MHDLDRGPQRQSTVRAHPWSIGDPKTASEVGRTLKCVAYTKDPRVNAYVDGLPQWQQTICQRVRDLVHAADAQVQGTIERRVQPYFVLEGNICALSAAKDHVNVFLHDGGIVPDPEGIITGGHDNQAARTVAIHENEPINEAALVAIFRQIVANNRAGGWRKLKSGLADECHPGTTCRSRGPDLRVFPSRRRFGS